MRLKLSSLLVALFERRFCEFQKFSDFDDFTKQEIKVLQIACNNEKRNRK